MKKKSTFYGPDINGPIRSRAQGDTPAGRAALESMEAAAWWMERSYDELYSLMFGPTIKRSWMVLSYGNCPSCGGSVPMYNWVIDPMRNPWKVECPHCSELFPKNDFEAFYRSGLDDKGIFNRSLADASLLINESGTAFGVDDGDGYVNEEGERWRFIGAYLVYGQWMILVRGGIEHLSSAYFLTGEAEYARRAAIMLYRISELFPNFDFTEQGVMYDKERTSSGYVTYWVTTCHDIRVMAESYDMIFDGLEDDSILEDFLAAGISDIKASIENRILREALDHPEKYVSNPPDSSNVRTLIKATLGWPENRDEVLRDLDVMIKTATKVDGLVGEKGLASYAAIAPLKLADMLLLFANVEDDFLHFIFTRYPVLERTYRFHIDTWYMNSFYPGCGDSGVYGGRTTEYPAALFARYKHKIQHRSREWFMWCLYGFFKDPAFAQVIYISNSNSVEGCFSRDLYLEDPSALRGDLAEFIDSQGTDLAQRSVNFEEWRLAVLHSGTGGHRRMVSMGYDSGANHSHHDALNINLFFMGENLSPDFGYPPVNYGGWYTPEVEWYRHPASHNLVVVDGKGHTNLPSGKFLRYPEYGRTLLFHSGSFAQAVYADAHEYAGVERFERLIGLVDVSDQDAYVIDIFRVKGGEDHTKFFRTSPANRVPRGLNLEPGEPYGHGGIMRNFLTDNNPESGWSADFSFEGESGIGLLYADLTSGARAVFCDSWVDITSKFDGSGNQVLWVPTLMVRRGGPESTFVSVLVPYQDTAHVRSIRRIDTGTDTDVAIEVALENGKSDLILAADPAGAGTVRSEEHGIQTDSPFCVIRSENGKVEKASIPDGFSFE